MKPIFKKFAAIVLAAVIVAGVNAPAVFAAVDTYTVLRGDSLWLIAKKYQVGVTEIIQSNPQFKDPDLIFPGDKVYVPLPDPVVVSMTEQVVALVNQERSKAGLQPLSINWEVARVARIKSEEMRDKNYFSHTSPLYGSPFDMLKKFAIPYRAAGENIAKGQKTAQAVMKSWMASEGHRKNILSPTFTQIGVGYCVGAGSTYWTQIFILP